ncbi:uncharacterized protein HMPREF1541_05498 [Cyphellophora europaea CBS 101466]|uniref:Uncharacterized protein n=1 Tax=Cyphellophora europaea (strain CBS 101466) TaxID=1220924 RepID=W2RSI2_CYPE1|nr:uncharacterized protein HMPREF1541_05498 [Cyphellophora europaea CBS 101466]ETN39275.1 hypothetical protein HMPREF1541_05498 [Cyphellophora europaea CBS 101466]
MDRDHSRPVPPFYRNLLSTVDLIEARSALLLPLSPLADDGKHLHNVLSAVRGPRLQLSRLRLQDTQWSSLSGQGPSMLSHVPAWKSSFWASTLGSLKHLDLSFRGKVSRHTIDSVKPLRRLLKGCPKLESLQLSFNEAVQRRYAHEHRMISCLGPLLAQGHPKRALVPHLSSLVLKNSISSQQDLIQFLSIHASTLRKLSLSNISLLRHEDQDRKPCWVATMKDIKASLSLTQVTFSGWFTNGGRQKWYVSNNAASNHRIRPAVQRYMTNRNETHFPLERVAVQPGHEDVEKPPPGAEEFRGDWTWTMTYSPHKPRHVHEQTYSGNEFFSKDVSLDRRDDEPLSSRSVRRTYALLADTQPDVSTLPPTDGSWHSYYQQPPSKKVKSVHSPTSLQSPSSLWSSSPEAWDSSTSSVFDSLATTASKTVSSSTSKVSGTYHNSVHTSVYPPHGSMPGTNSCVWGWPKTTVTDGDAWLSFGTVNSFHEEPASSNKPLKKQIKPDFATSSNSKLTSTPGWNLPTSDLLSMDLANGLPSGPSGWLLGPKDVPVYDAFDFGFSTQMASYKAPAIPECMPDPTDQGSLVPSSYNNDMSPTLPKIDFSGSFVSGENLDHGGTGISSSGNGGWGPPSAFKLKSCAELQAEADAMDIGKGKGKAVI